MSKSFFLTRQTANLLEDFVRELKANAGLYLIYGDQGVGKTRLLEELARNRLADSKIRWIDLQAGAEGDGALVDSSELIEKTFIKAEPGDIIVADHFEKALKKSRHQLFLNWSTDGVDKQLNLIIAASSEFFNELRQLAQQYQVRVQSFQQMPFSGDETEAFLGFYLFPDRPIGKLVIPSLLRNQLAMTKGNVGKIIEIAERAGDQISSGPMNDSESIRQGSRVIVALLVVVAVIAGVSWYFLGSQTRNAGQAVTLNEAGVNAQPSAEIEATSQGEPVVESLQSDPPVVAVNAVSDDDVVESALDAAGDTTPQATTLKPSGAGDENAPDALPAAGATLTMAAEADAGINGEAEEAIVATVDGEPADSEPLAGDVPAGTVEVSDEAPVEAAKNVIENEAVSSSAPAESEPVTPAENHNALAQSTSDAERLRQDLQTSLEWIAGRDRSIGTLQLMVLRQENFDLRNYYHYVESLARQGVDVSRMRIFATYTGNRKVYSVVYGEYPSRVEASNAKSALPAVLRKASPVPRSVGGLREEIRRLEEQN